MYERILVPVDGSAVAERAIPEAARIARAFGGTLMLVSVVTPPVSSGKFSSLEAYPQAATEEELALATTYLNTLAQSEPLAGITTQVHALAGGAAATIIAEAKSLNADLIVLCSHGYTGLQHWMLGSVAEKVIRHAPVPVFVLRAGGHEMETAAHPVRALVALDGSPVSETILEPAAALTAGLAQASSQPGALQLIRIVDIPSSYGKFRSQVDAFADAQARTEAKHDYEQYLQAMARRFAEGALEKYHLAVSTVVATDPDAATALVQAADQGTVDYIAMATHGRGGVQHWALGSITERVLHATKVPLFILRPPGV